MTAECLNEDTWIGLLLPARLIPDGSKVTKRTGQVEYVIRHKLTVFQNQDPKSNVPPIEIEGTFLVGSRGDISQINPETMLLWWGTARDVRDQLTDIVDDEEIPQ